MSLDRFIPHSAPLVVDALVLRRRLATGGPRLSTRGSASSHRRRRCRLSTSPTRPAFLFPCQHSSLVLILARARRPVIGHPLAALVADPDHQSPSSSGSQESARYSLLTRSGRSSRQQVARTFPEIRLLRRRKVLKPFFHHKPDVIFMTKQTHHTPIYRISSRRRKSGPTLGAVLLRVRQLLTLRRRLNRHLYITALDYFGFHHQSPSVQRGVKLIHPSSISRTRAVRYGSSPDQEIRSSIPTAAR